MNKLFALYQRIDNSQQWIAAKVITRSKAVAIRLFKEYYGEEELDPSCKIIELGGMTPAEENGMIPNIVQESVGYFNLEEI